MNPNSMQLSGQVRGKQSYSLIELQQGTNGRCPENQNNSSVAGDISRARHELLASALIL